MPDDLADLERLRAELLKFNASLRDPRASAGTRKRASKALGAIAIQAVDLALERLRERRQDGDQEDLV